jgi:hypothetical protein
MTDDRLDTLFQRLDRPATPDPAYADRAFGELAVEAGFRPRGGRGRWLATRLGPGLRDSTRLAWIVLAICLLGAMVVGILAVGSQQPRPDLGRVEPSPNVAVPGPSVGLSPSPSGRPSASVFRPGSDLLAIGRPAPDWTGQVLDGGAFSTGALRGRPAAVLLWCSCVSGPQARTFLDAARSRDDVAMVLVSLDSEGTTRGLVDWVGAESPVVLDSDFGLPRAWGLDSYPAMVLLRSDGAVADIQPLTFDAASLGEILDSLGAGAAIPDPRPLPPPPADSVPEPLSTVLEPGAVAPTLTGPKLGGGELSTTELRGRPTIVRFWLPPHLDGAPQDDSPGPDRLLAAAADHPGEVNVLLVAAGEPERGAARRALRQQDADVPVVFDWDGELADQWGLTFGNTMVVLDAEGHTEGVYGPLSTASAKAIVDALVAGDPLPSPDPERP